MVVQAWKGDGMSQDIARKEAGARISASHARFNEDLVSAINDVIAKFGKPDGDKPFHVRQHLITARDMALLEAHYHRQLEHTYKREALLLTMESDDYYGKVS